MFVGPCKVTYLWSFNQILISNPTSLWNNKNIHMSSSEILKPKKSFFCQTILSSQRVQLSSRFSPLGIHAWEDDYIGNLMREGKIYPMLVLEGGFLHGNIFGKHMNLQGVYGQSLSAFPYPQTASSHQGWIPREISCCSMTRYWSISEIGKFFSACNGEFFF